MIPVHNRRPIAQVAASLAILAATWPSPAADCTVTSVGFVPLNDLGPGFYVVGTSQFQGGLYPGGVNVPPPAHAAEGRARALAIRQLGTYVLLSIGMSNTTQEFCSQGGGLPCDAWTFMGQSALNPRVNTAQLRIANGALGGQAAATWDQPTDPNYDRVRDTVLAPQGLTEADVQVLWIKLARPQPNSPLPNFNAEAYQLKASVANVLRAARIRYPNCRIAFLSSRIYAGYAGYPVPTVSSLNPEPYAYESGFAMKWLIEAQINQMGGGGIDPQSGNLDYNSVVPWIAWGPYLWADGTTARSDGLTYLCGDLQSDGTHPATAGEQKVGALLLNFMLGSRFAAPWFRRCEPADLNADGEFDAGDVAPFTSTLLDPAAATDAQRCAADCNDDGHVDAADVTAFVARLLAPF
jgi:hypothetical protein